MRPEVGDDRPLLVIVSGRPASGKTTLATLLAVELHLPLLTKDAIKESLAEVIAVTDRQASGLLGAAAYRVLYRFAGALIDAGVGCVLESNFERGKAEEALAPLAERSRAVFVMCEAPDALCLERYRLRAASGTRHRAHFDDVVVEAWSRSIVADHGPLEIGAKVITVDTTDGYRPPLPSVVALVLASP